jgi:hypothetical protein
MTCWLPVEVWGVTELPDAAAEVTAGVAPGDAPALTTKIWKVGVAEGTGTHWNAQPMFQVPAAMVKAALVQLPDCWVLGMSTVAGPATTGAVVEDPVAAAPPAAVVEVDPPAAVVAVEPPAPLVVVAEPAAPLLDELPEVGTVVPVDPEGGGSL